MKKDYTILIVLVLVLLAIGLTVFKPFSGDNTETILPQDYKDATYIIEGQPITLENGVFEMETTPNSATKTITRYFGNEIQHDLNDDSLEDVAFILTQENGGSGIFYYFVAALNTPEGYIGSEAVFLGDRIAPQSTEMDEGMTSNGTNRQNVIIVNYAVRLPDEPFTVQPSVGKSIWLKLDPETVQFGEVAQNFEGESNNNPEVISCQAEQRNADFCNEIYQPVCALVNVQCIKAPCDPIKETYSNSCKACTNSLVSSYTQGECLVVNTKTTEWEKIIQAIQNCNVKTVAQTHSKKVTVTLKNGNDIEAFEPNLDDVFDIVAESKEKCGEILLMTE
ncbi:hypothetical protein KJ603_02575 [Patescibacteria group bacterium]|nr:hypothetical protein [Patescibacteria group bacterium]